MLREPLPDSALPTRQSQRERRYQSAEEMQADLALLQSGQSVRRVRLLERRAALARRFGWAAALVVVLALSAARFANWRARAESASRAKERALREQAQQSLARAESAELLARQQLNAALFPRAGN